MPSYTHSRVTVRGDDATVTALFDLLKHDRFPDPNAPPSTNPHDDEGHAFTFSTNSLFLDFHNILPLSPNISPEAAQLALRRGESPHNLLVYERRQAWGTSYIESGGLYQDDPHSFFLRTPWTTFEPVVAAMAKRSPTLRIELQAYFEGVDAVLEVKYSGGERQSRNEYKIDNDEGRRVLRSIGFTGEDSDYYGKVGKFIAQLT